MDVRSTLFALVRTKPLVLTTALIVSCFLSPAGPAAAAPGEPPLISGYARVVYCWWDGCWVGPAACSRIIAEGLAADKTVLCTAGPVSPNPDTGDYVLTMSDFTAPAGTPPLDQCQSFRVTASWNGQVLYQFFRTVPAEQVNFYFHSHGGGGGGGGMSAPGSSLASALAASSFPSSSQPNPSGLTAGSTVGPGVSALASGPSVPSQQAPEIPSVSGHVFSVNCSPGGRDMCVVFAVQARVGLVFWAEDGTGPWKVGPIESDPVTGFFCFSKFGLQEKGVKYGVVIVEYMGKMEFVPFSRLPAHLDVIL